MHLRFIILGCRTDLASKVETQISYVTRNWSVTIVTRTWSHIFLTTGFTENLLDNNKGRLLRPSLIMVIIAGFSCCVKLLRTRFFNRSSLAAVYPGLIERISPIKYITELVVQLSLWLGLGDFQLLKKIMYYIDIFFREIDEITFSYYM